MAHIRGILVSIILLLTFFSVSVLLWIRYARRVVQIPAFLDSYWDILKEKRRFMRFKERLPVSCSVARRTGSVHRIYSSDISGEGICLQVPEMLPEKTTLDLKIEIPNDDPVVIKGEVVWVKEAEAEAGQTERLFDTGVRFTKIKADDKARLGVFLASIMNRYGI